MTRPLPRIWGGLGITGKLWAAFSLLSLFFAMAGAAGFGGLAVVGGAEKEILANMEIRNHVLELEGQLEKARRLYRDFLLEVPKIGFQKAQELYCRPALASAARMIAISEELKRRLAASRHGGEIAKRNVDINLFSATARRYSHVLLQEIELVTSLVDPNDGLEGRLSGLMTRLGGIMAGSPELSLALREIDVLEKQYRITRQRPTMQAALNIVGRLREELPRRAELSPDGRAEAAALLAEYAATVGNVLDTVVAMTANAHDFVLQSMALDPIAEELKTLSAIEVSRARERIVWASRIADGIILASALLGLGCVVFVGRVLHASITSKIVELTRHAAAIRSGSLHAVTTIDSRDELGVLAGTLNAMMRRIRDLVENLEAKVRQRTGELAAKNHELDLKNKALRLLSLTDRLTGLCNRRKLDQTLQAEWRRAQRYGAPYAVLMVDLDHFKRINDTYGHDVGDAVLLCMGEILVALSRDTDIVGRWGGEEFLLVCPETGEAEAMALAEKLRREIEDMDFPTVGRCMTASFGLAAYAGHPDPELLVRHADEALYRAKQGGRNRVEAAGGG